MIAPTWWRNAALPYWASGTPSTSTSPAVGSSRPSVIFISVVLPPPDGPTSSRVSQGSTSRFTLSSTSGSPAP